MTMKNVLLSQLTQTLLIVLLGITAFVVIDNLIGKDTPMEKCIKAKQVTKDYIAVGVGFHEVEGYSGRIAMDREMWEDEDFRSDVRGPREIRGIPGDAVGLDSPLGK